MKVLTSSTATTATTAATAATSPGLSTPEWYEQIAGNAIDGNRHEGYMLASIGEDVADYWQEGDKTATEILAYLVKHKTLVRVEWGGDDVRYYFPEEVVFKGPYHELRPIA